MVKTIEVKIKGETFKIYSHQIFGTKQEAFDYPREAGIRNNYKVYKTDDGKYAVFFITGQDLANLY